MAPVGQRAGLILTLLMILCDVPSSSAVQNDRCYPVINRNLLNPAVEICSFQGIGLYVFIFITQRVLLVMIFPIELNRKKLEH